MQTSSEGIPISEAARRLERSANRVRQLVDSGQLAAVRTPLGRLVDAADLERYLRERAAQNDGGAA